MNLALGTRSLNGAVVLEVKGEVDLYTAPKLRERLNDLVAEGNRRIILDLTGLDFLDSTGLGVLVGGLKRLKEQEGSLDLVGLQPPVRKVLAITGLDKVFSIRDGIDDVTD